MSWKLRQAHKRGREAVRTRADDETRAAQTETDCTPCALLCDGRGGHPGAVRGMGRGKGGSRAEARGPSGMKRQTACALEGVTLHTVHARGECMCAGCV